MKHNTMHDCKLIDLRKISDPRGNLTVIEGNGDIPFEIKRVYYLYDVQEASHVVRMLIKNFINY